jgi:hypothetical protein
VAQNPPRPTPPTQNKGISGKLGPRTDVRPDVERAMAVAAVMDHAVRVKKETSGPMRPHGAAARSKWPIFLLIPMIALAVYSWVAKPEFIWGPGVQPLPPARQEANARVAMFLLAQRIEAFRAKEGEYPTSLRAIGDSLAGVTYARVDSVYELRAVEAGKPIVYRPDRPANAFLGNSSQLIQGPR